MRQLLTYLLLMLLVQSCVLSEKNTDLEIIYAPKLDIDFKSDPNFAEYKNSRILLYNSRNKLFLDTIIYYDIPQESFNVAHGVNPGLYTMVTVSNFEKSIVSGVEDSASVDMMRIELSPIDCDRIFINTSQHELRRGDPKVCTEGGKSLFYDLTLTLTHVSELTVDPVEPYVELSGLKSQFNHLGEVTSPTTHDIRLPELKSLENGDLQTKSTIAKFIDSDKVVIKVKELIKETIETIEIHPSDYIDAKTTKPQVLNIVMRYKAHSYELYINDWYIGSYQLSNIGG